MGEQIVSVLIPVHNEASFIEACLTSIMASPPIPGIDGIEAIVVDDHSSDETAAIVARLAEQTPRWPIRLFSNPGRGKVSALNCAYHQAQGSIFILLGGDDLIVPQAIAGRTRPLLEPGPRIIASLYQTISDNKELDGHVLPRKVQSDHIAGGACSFNHEFADLYFPIPESLPNEDTWLRAIILRDAIPVLRLPQVGLLYRLHAGNTMGQDRSFDQASLALERRHKAYELAARTSSSPTQDRPGQQRLEALCRAEKLRIAGRWYAIPFVRHLSLGDILTNMVNSREWIYLIKSRLIRLKGRLQNRHRPR